MKHLLLLLLWSFLAINTIYADTIEVYVLAGQSNAIGWFGDAANYPADPNNYDNQIRLSYMLDWNGSGPKSENWWLPNPIQPWIPKMTAQTGRFTAGHFGPEVTLSRLLHANSVGNKKIAIFKYGQGSTSLADTWKKPGEAGMYDRMKTRLIDHLNFLVNQGHTVILKGYIWIQGEEDAKTDAHSNAYSANLTLMLNDIKALATSYNNSNLRIILGVDELNPQITIRPQVILAQQIYAKNNCNATFTSMRGLPKIDNIHLTIAGILSQGERIYNDIIANNRLGQSALDITGTTEEASCGTPSAEICSASSAAFNQLIINRVIFNAITKPSNASSYTFHNDVTTDVVRGLNTSISLRSWTNLNPVSYSWNLWIDFNGNNVFESSEKVVSTMASAGGESTYSFIIPNTSTLGEKRMRIIVKKDAICNNPCEIVPQGEVEDFKVNIVNNTSGGGGGSSTYCNASSTIFNTNFISRVNLGTINKFSNGSSYTYYQDSVDIARGSSQSIILRTWTANVSSNVYWTAWIDYNGNNVFEDSEKLGQAIRTGSGEVTINFNVPSGTFSGITRMRVIARSDAYGTACGSFNLGEVEDYNVNLTGGSGSGGSTTYCAASGNNFSSSIISRVALGTINKFSNGSSYSFHTDQTTNLYKGASSNITLRSWCSSASTPLTWGVWIDFNQNNIFENEEKVVETTAIGSGEIIRTINIPSSVLSGNTRMRVVMSQESSTVSCGSFALGEVEDYTITIANSSRLSSDHSDIKYNPTLYPNPVRDILNLQNIFNDNQDVIINIYDMTGKLVSNEIIITKGVSNHIMNVNNLDKGFYFMNVSSKDKESVVLKFIKH